MGGTAKTRANDRSVEDVLNGVSNETRRGDSFALLDIYRRATGEEPRMWGTSIVGFGEYHTRSGGRGQEGHWPLAAFSPRKQGLTLYVTPEKVDHSDLLGALGKHKTSKACLYINKLADVDTDVLEQIVRRSYLDAKKTLT